MLQNPKYNVIEGAIYTYHPPVMTKDRFQIIEPIPPLPRKRGFWGWTTAIVGGVLLVGILVL
jgi:hypothetical protein